MLMEIMFIMDKLHDCASSRLKRVGFGDKVDMIHNSLIDRIKTKLRELLLMIKPDPTIPDPVLDPKDEFIYRFCFILFSYFKTNFNSGNYEATILTFLVACLKKLDCEINIKQPTSMMRLIRQLNCVVVNNAVMGKPPTDHPFTYKGQPDKTHTVTVCTPGGTYTDGGTVFEKWPVYLKPRNISVEYQEQAIVKPFMKLSYKEMELLDDFDSYTDDQVIHLFDEFLKVNIFDTKTGVSHSYPINPMRKVHNKMVVSDELSQGYFSGAQPFTDKKGLCDFLQHFLLLAANKDEDAKKDICFAVYQNDLMSVIFHILTMISVCESGALGTSVNSITAVLYCPLRVLVFRIIPTSGLSSSSHTYELDCVKECTDDTVEDEDGDFDDDTQNETTSTSSSSSSVSVPTNPTNGSGGGIITASSGRVPMKGGTVKSRSRKLNYKATTIASMVSMRRKSRKKLGSMIPRSLPNHETPPKFSNEVFDFIQEENDPRSLFLAFKYKYYKSNQLTTETLKEFIANDNSPSNPGTAPSEEKTIGVDPILFRDREFIYYQHLKRWMVSEGKWDDKRIKELNQKIDHAFEMERDLRMENERLILSKLLSMVDVEIGAEEKNSQPRGRSLSKSNRSRKISRNPSRNRSRNRSRKNSIGEGLPRAYLNQTKVRARSLTPGPRSRARSPFKRSPMPISGPKSAPKTGPKSAPIVDQ
jgi:hypothetical protein